MRNVDFPWERNRHIGFAEALTRDVQGAISKMRFSTEVRILDIDGLDQLENDPSLAQSANDSESRAVSFANPNYKAVVRWHHAVNSAVVCVGAHTQVCLDQTIEWIQRSLGSADIATGVSLTTFVNGEWNRASMPPVPWHSTEKNYPGLRSELEAAMAGPDRLPDGSLLIWHGPHGVGKTWAVQSLATSWASLGFSIELHRGPVSRSLDHIVDLTTRSARSGLRKLVILEEASDLTSSGRHTAAGGWIPNENLKVLLEAGDGLLSRGSEVYIMITGNSSLGDLAPSAVRAGRCASHLCFPLFTPQQATARLGYPISWHISLADIYKAELSGEPPQGPSQPGSYL